MARVTQRIERMVGQVRSWRSGTTESGIGLAADLPDGVHLRCVEVEEQPGCVARYRPANADGGNLTR